MSRIIRPRAPEARRGATIPISRVDGGRLGREASQIAARGHGLFWPRGRWRKKERRWRRERPYFDIPRGLSSGFVVSSPALPLRVLLCLKSAARLVEKPRRMLAERPVSKRRMPQLQPRREQWGETWRKGYGDPGSAFELSSLFLSPCVRLRLSFCDLSTRSRAGPLLRFVHTS